MEDLRYQIRICQNQRCEMRYPLMKGNAFGESCPRCGSETQLVEERLLIPESRSEQAMRNSQGYLVVLDNIRSAWNVGSIFRTAEGMGVEHIYLCGITPTPDIPKVARTALGAEKMVPWSYYTNCLGLVKDLRKKGFNIWALETHANASQLVEAPSRMPGGRVVLVFGNEVVGVDPGVLDLCDHIWCIPMHGRKRSLNTAVAFGIAAHIFTSIKQG